MAKKKASTGKDDARVEVLLQERPEGLVAHVFYDRRAKLNTLSTQGMTLLIATMKKLAKNPKLRCVVFSGAGGKAFIGGANIAEMATLSPAGGKKFITLVHGVCKAMREMPVPVIARIQGYCLGAGPEVAAGCDLRVCTPVSVFGMPEVRVGVPSVVEAAILPRLIGWGRTSEFLMVAENIDAKTAYEWRLVEKVVPDEEIDAAVEQWVSAILKATPKAMRAQKALMRKWENLTTDQAVKAGIAAFASSLKTGEARERMGEFMSRKR
jgi:enoyl-CoA hydratase